MNNSHAEEPSSDTNHTELIQQILANPNSEMAKSLTQSKKKNIFIVNPLPLIFVTKMFFSDGWGTKTAA